MQIKICDPASNILNNSSTFWQTVIHSYQLAITSHNLDSGLLTRKRSSKCLPWLNLIVFFCGVQRVLFCVVQCWRTAPSVRRPFHHRKWQPRPARASSKVREILSEFIPNISFFSFLSAAEAPTASYSQFFFPHSFCRPSRLGAWWSL